MVRQKQIFRAIILCLLVAVSTPGYASAQAASASPNYRVNEVFFGSGGSLNDCSASYCAKTAAGETGVGNISSPGYQAHAGFNTDRTPYLEFIVNPVSINLGVLSSGTTKTATASFQVKSYLTSGYVVQTVSDPPANGAYHLSAPSSPTASNSAAEQFGINLVANTAPAAFGANPVEVPDSSFSHGVAAPGYNTPNMFKYVKGDTIAQSSQSSGETDYTISYIFNITNMTPGGTYTMNQVLVATSTF